MICEIFYKEYPDFESFKKDVYEKIDIGLQQVREGKYRPADEFFKEIDADVEDLAKIIAMGINITLHKSMKESYLKV